MDNKHEKFILKLIDAINLNEESSCNITKELTIKHKGREIPIQFNTSDDKKTLSIIQKSWIK